MKQRVEYWVEMRRIVASAALLGILFWVGKTLHHVEIAIFLAYLAGGVHMKSIIKQEVEV